MPESLLVALAFVDGVVGGFDADPGELVAVDGVELPCHEREGGVSEAAAEEVLEMLAPEVLVASLAALGEGGVVVLEATDGAVVGDADEEGATEFGVGEAGDGLDSRVLGGTAPCLPVDIPAQGGLVLQVLRLTVGAQQVADGTSPLAGGDGPLLHARGEDGHDGVARAIVTGPKFVVLDEPTSSLDLSVQAGILELLANLQRDLGLAYLFISHDIGTVDYFSDRVAVMYLGQVVETGPKAAVLDTPRHPYTEALLSAALPADPTEQPPHIALTGDIPSPTQLPEGCFFYSRCNYRGDPRCATENPPLRQVGPNHWAATFCNVGGTAETA